MRSAAHAFFRALTRTRCGSRSTAVRRVPTLQARHPRRAGTRRFTAAARGWASAKRLPTRSSRHVGTRQRRCGSRSTAVRRVPTLQSAIPPNVAGICRSASARASWGGQVRSACPRFLRARGHAPDGGADRDRQRCGACPPYKALFPKRSGNLPISARASWGGQVRNAAHGSSAHVGTRRTAVRIAIDGGAARAHPTKRYSPKRSGNSPMSPPQHRRMGKCEALAHAFFASCGHAADAGADRD